MEDIFYLGFSAFPGVGPVTFEKLLQMFGSAENAWKAEKSALLQVLGDILGEKFILFRKTFTLEKYAESLEKKDIHYLFSNTEFYPKLLQSVPSRPYVLYYKGNASVLYSEKAIGIVGTRKVTDYGREITQKFSEELVHQGFVIVSGLAFGVDGIAHTTTLDKSGKTIAVLGSGVDICTPVEHKRIYERILENNGCIVSGVVPGERPNKGSFPARNRIIAGLSSGILVTEGAADSGALITADYARKFNRPVFAVPGPITSDVSKGTNNLIKSGAVAITDSGEILDRLGIMVTPKAFSVNRQVLRGDTQEEKEILNLLETHPLHFDDIVRKMGKDSSTIGSLLSLMELKGLIKIVSNGKYSLG